MFIFSYSADVRLLLHVHAAAVSNCNKPWRTLCYRQRKSHSPDDWLPGWLRLHQCLADQGEFYLQWRRLNEIKCTALSFCPTQLLALLLPACVDLLGTYRSCPLSGGAKMLWSESRHVRMTTWWCLQGYGNRGPYIAAQGPNDLALADFIRMVWEQDTSIVVMLANLIEKGRVRYEHW